MKTSVKFNVKGVEFDVKFEGSVRELAGINTAMVNGTREWLDLFAERGDQMFNMLDRAIDRVSITNKKIILAEKEDKDFRDILNGNYKK